MIKLKGKVDKKNIQKLIDLELYSVQNSLEIQQGLHKQILIFFKDFAESMDIEENNELDNIHKYINDANFNLKKIQFNIDTIQTISKKITILKSETENITKKDLEDNIEEYNKIYEDLMNKVFINTTNIQNFIQEISFIHLENASTEADDTENSNSENENKNLIENTLTISEMQGKVILPYTIQELTDLLNENSDEYTSIEDVIEKKYVKPFSYYRFSAISRFKEAYKLIMDKEHGSKLSAIELAIELFSNYNLHPAIITACKNLNQLDIYLSCLEYDELSDFHFFKINYEFAPTIVNHFSFFGAKKINEVSNSEIISPEIHNNAI